MTARVPDIGVDMICSNKGSCISRFSEASHVICCEGYTKKNICELETTDESAYVWQTVEEFSREFLYRNTECLDNTFSSILVYFPAHEGRAPHIGCFIRCECATNQKCYFLRQIDNFEEMRNQVIQLTCGNAVLATNSIFI